MKRSPLQSLLKSQLKFLALGLAACIAPSLAFAQQALVIKPLAEKKVAELPPGELYWRIDNFASPAEAKAAAGPWSLVVESAGKVWLFTLGASGKSSANATQVTEVGPIPRVSATEYLLRINDASGPPGSTTPVHSHPGSEAIFVLTGEQSIRGAQGTVRVAAGHAEAGQAAERSMQVSSSGTTDLHALVMFVVDAGKPFSSPAAIP
jgi:hypothetical protein